MYLKKLLTAFCIALTAIAYGQQTQSISVQIQKQVLTVLLNDAGNSNKSIILHTNKSGHLTIVNYQWQQEDSTRNRSFMLTDGKDSLLYTFNKSKKGKYKQCLKKLKPLLTKGGRYMLYTVALPKDPELAARIRVRRMLVCNIDVQ